MIDTGGRSAAAGTWHLLRDMSSPPRVPEMVPADAFEVGTDLGLTPGAVVRRDPVYELIQYRPRTPSVRTTPLVTWLAAAKTEPGSWWPDYDAWLADRSGPEKPSPQVLGNARFTAFGSAPGSYVADR